jgi:hypothetical protein
MIAMEELPKPGRPYTITDMTKRAVTDGGTTRGTMEINKKTWISTAREVY